MPTVIERRLADLERLVAEAERAPAGVAAKPVDAMTPDEIIEEWRRLTRGPCPPRRLPPLSPAEEARLEAEVAETLAIIRARRADDAARLLASGFWQQQGRQSA
jgi:hypothetical protein